MATAKKNISKADAPIPNGARVQVTRGDFKARGSVVGKHPSTTGEWYEVNVAPPRADADVRKYRRSNLKRV